MALTGLDIYKKLPKTNCKECGLPTCLAFAMKVAAGQAGLDDCPQLTDEARSDLSEASAPPQRLVKIVEGHADGYTSGDFTYRFETFLEAPLEFCGFKGQSPIHAAIGLPPVDILPEAAEIN